MHVTDDQKVGCVRNNIHLIPSRGRDFNACFPGWWRLSTLSLRTPMPRFNTIVWNSAHLVETPRQRPAAAQFRSLTLAAPH